MKIYTRTGDKGSTSLVGGTRVSKTDPRIEAYGMADELISYLGLIRDLIPEHQSHSDFLLWIQDRLMTCASNLAAESHMDFDQQLPSLADADIDRLEQSIDQMESELSPLQSFILPGGHQAVSFCHIARNVCRKTERSVLRVEQPIREHDRILKFLNRLSDYLFVLARKLADELGAREIPWKPKI